MYSTIYDLIIHSCQSVIDVIDCYDEPITDETIRKVPENLDFKFSKTVTMFMTYILFYRKKSTQRLEYLILKMYVMILNGPRGKYSIGQNIVHNSKCAFIVDYLYQLDLYKIQYTDASPLGETHGWFRCTEFRSTND